MSATTAINPNTQTYPKHRKAAKSNNPSIFADIYEEDTNIAIWQRDLSSEIGHSIEKLLASNRSYQASFIAAPENIFNQLIENDAALSNAHALCENIAELVEMFCVLFDLKEVGLRLTALDRAMCPRFHVDWVPCRLVCTYHGVASEWLLHNVVDRSKLGTGNNGLDDEESGLFNDMNDINQLNIGDVAILKGERWQGNAGAGLVHRSPQVPELSNRLLLTLDFVS